MIAGKTASTKGKFYFPVLPDKYTFNTRLDQWFRDFALHLPVWLPSLR